MGLVPAAAYVAGVAARFGRFVLAVGVGAAHPPQEWTRYVSAGEPWAVLRVKDAAGLAEWATRRWLMFAHAPTVLDVTDEVGDWLAALWDGGPAACGAAVWCTGHARPVLGWAREHGACSAVRLAPDWIVAVPREPFRFEDWWLRHRVEYGAADPWTFPEGVHCRGCGEQVRDARDLDRHGSAGHRLADYGCAMDEGFLIRTGAHRTTARAAQAAAALTG